MQDSWHCYLLRFRTHTLDLVCCQSSCTGCYTLAHAACRYERAPHLQLFLGPPGIGKTTLLRKLAPCIMDELDANPCWLHGSGEFRAALRSSLGAPIPFVFDLVCVGISTLQRLAVMPSSSLDQLQSMLGHGWG